MTCEQIKQDIYLYDELSSAEKEACDKHIKTCVACERLFHEVQQQKSLINQAAAWQAKPDNSALMTQQIMEAVITSKAKNTSPIAKLIHKFNLSQLRLAFASLALFLTVFFFWEFNQPWSHAHRSSPEVSVNESRKASILDTNQVFENIKRRKREKAKQVARGNCVKSLKVAGKTHVYDQCESGIQKFLRKHESH